MKIRMTFGVVKTVIMYAIVVIALGLSGLDIAMLAGAMGIATTMPAIAAVSLVASVLIAVACLFVLFGSFYRFEEDRLVVTLGFFKDVIEYENVTAIRQDGNTRELFLFYRLGKIGDAENVVKFSVDKKKIDDLIQAVKTAMPDMIIEVFTPTEKKPKH